MLNRRHLLAALALTACAGTHAQQRPIRLIVPYPPGGPLDVIARLLADKAKDSLGTVVVENKPGAGGNLGADLVAKSAPDGHTIVMGAVATHAINPWLYAKMPYDALRDFTPITLVAQVPNVLVMNADTAKRLGIRTRRRPGRVREGTPGPAELRLAAATAAPATWPARCSRRRPVSSWCTSPTAAARRRSWRCCPDRST